MIPPQPAADIHSDSPTDGVGCVSMQALLDGAKIYGDADALQQLLKDAGEATQLRRPGVLNGVDK
jgi:hypothetical protein